MSHNGPSPTITPELIRELRETARRPTTVRELVRVIQKRYPAAGDSPLPVIAGLVHAFHLPLVKVLPVREWIGTDDDAEIDALILPEIEKSRSKWEAGQAPSAGVVSGEGAGASR